VTTDAIGNIPESDLTSAERQLLENLRKDLAIESSAGKVADGPVTGNGGGDKERKTPIERSKAAETEFWTEAKTFGLAESEVSSITSDPRARRLLRPRARFLS
jgi:hypothetical protein